ncbi:protein SMG9-like [Chenopodium quinoa]|uniref:protein SMG9-like n=1 Tax=Chenopodium quinoa TaxID=63459 RepID=UPI000B785698|nr:protein SMG9-like [Chenopodium quinoa]
MASSGGGGAGGPSSPSPKILLAKPGLVAGSPSAAGKFIRGAAGEDDASLSAASIRSRLPPVGSLNLLSDSWDFHFDRFLPFLTDNTDFTVIGVIGSPGVGKSTIMNEIYGFDPTSPGMLPPFAIQSEETRANARHCTTGIEPRISSERLILLDTQPVFSPSVLAEMTRPDGSSTVPVLGGETLSSELAHELLCIQLGVLLSSVCHVLLVVSEGAHEANMWRLMSTVDLLKHGLPDPSSVTSHLQSSSSGTDKDNKDKFLEGGEEYMATPVFIHTKLRDEDVSPQTCEQMKKVLGQYFHSSSFTRPTVDDHISIPKSHHSEDTNVDPKLLDLFLVPRRKDNPLELRCESCDSMLWRIRDHILSMARPSFARTVSERDWLKNTAKIWELVKNSPTIADYCRTLQNSGLFRR